MNSPVSTSLIINTWRFPQHGYPKPLVFQLITNFGFWCTPILGHLHHKIKKISITIHHQPYHHSAKLGNSHSRTIKIINNSLTISTIPTILYQPYQSLVVSSQVGQSVDGPGAGRTGSYLQGRSAQEMLGSVSMESHGDAPIVWDGSMDWFQGQFARKTHMK